MPRSVVFGMVLLPAFATLPGCRNRGIVNVRRIFYDTLMGFINLDLESIEDYVANHLRLFISMVAGLLIFVGIIAISVFFIVVRGAEQTMVPDVQGLELTKALMDLQVKELYPRIQLRYTQTSADKGLILEQNPMPGTIVKAGRRIRLVVSQGALVNTIENYLGKNIDDVRMDLHTLYA